MILLFNTAYRPGYLRNILRTIFLPSGAKNQYRYTLGVNISQEEVSELLSKGENHPVLICYGDRFSPGGYTFYPVRFGLLESIECSGGRAYFRVCLEGHASCENESEFTRIVYGLTQVGRAPPQLINNDPKESKDGSYAVYVESTFEDIVKSTELSWAATSEKLANTTAFLSTKKDFVFAKCDLIVNGKKKNYASSNGVTRYEIDKEQDVRLAISYLFPAQKDNSNLTAKITLSAPAGFQLLGPATQVIDMPENRIEFPFAIEPGSEKDYFTVDVAINQELGAGGAGVVDLSEALAFRVYEPVWRPWLAFLAIVIYAAGATVAATKQNYAPIGELLKTIGVVGIYIGLRGKRIV